MMAGQPVLVYPRFRLARRRPAHAGILAALLALGTACAAAPSAEPRYAVLDPRGHLPPITHVTLAERLPSLAGKRIAIIKSWADNSGFDQVIEQIRDDLTKRGATVRIRDRNTPYSEDDPKLWDDLGTSADGFVYVAAASSSTTAYAFKWSAALEKRKLPGVIVNFFDLNSVGDQTNQRSGTAVRRAVFRYPPEKMALADRNAAIASVAAGLTAPLTAAERRVDTVPTPVRPAVLMTGDIAQVQRRFYDMGLTDGLPIVPPTQALVDAMLKGTSHKASEVVSSHFPPEDQIATVREVAINGVMAGCSAEHLPVLLASVEAFQKYNMNAMLRSTNSFSYMQVVNGPIRRQIAMNAESNAVGPGNRSNACMGRALRLFVTNLGDGQFGRNLMAVIGSNSNYSFMFAENEEATPWPTLAEDQGFARKDNVLTLFVGGWSHSGNYGLGTGIEDVPPDLARFQLPTGAVVIVSPSRARAIEADGMSKKKFVAFLQEKSCRTLGDLRKEGRFQDISKLAGRPDSDCIPRFAPGTIKVVVAGNSAAPMMQAWSMGRAQTVSIDRWK